MPAGTNPLLILGLAVALIIGIGVIWWVNRRPGAGHHGPRVQPLFGSDVGDVSISMERSLAPADAEPRFPAAPKSFAAPVPPPARAVRTPIPPAVTEVHTPIAPPVTQVREAVPRQAPVAEERTARPTPPGSSPAPYANSITAWTTTAASASVPGKLVEGHLVRFSVPNDGTLQFLPGRLEVSAGHDTGREIRFVRLPGPDGTIVTFGRSEGPLYRHVQLNDLTVSRAHARMRLADGRWHLTNLSQTNPVAHNGRVLGDDEEQLLEDGDRIDMGEVVFRFRSR